MWAMTKRNLKVFFRDRSSVFFSLLAVFIIIALYAVFLGDTSVLTPTTIVCALIVIVCGILTAADGKDLFSKSKA